MASRKVIITCSDSDNNKQHFEASVDVCKRISITLKNLIEDVAPEDPTVAVELYLDYPYNIVSKLFEFATQEEDLAKTSSSEENEKARKQFYTTYFSKYLAANDAATHNEMADLTSFSNYLEYKSLLECMTTGVAQILKNGTPDEIRKRFDLKDDLTEAEKEAIRKECEWATSVENS